MDTDNNLILKQQRDRARQQIPVLPAVQPNFNAPPSPTDNQPGEPLLQPRAADTYQAPPTFDPLAPLDMSGLVEPSNTIVPTAGSTPLQIQDKLLAPLEQQSQTAIDVAETQRLDEVDDPQDLSILNYNPPNIDAQIADGNARIDALSRELDVQERERAAQAQNKYQGQSLSEALQLLDREPAEGSLAPVFKKVGDYFGGSVFTDPRDGRQYSTPYVALTQRALGLPETQKEGPPNIVGALLYGLNAISAAPIAYAKDRLDQINRIQHNLVESMPWLKANQEAQTRWMQRNAPAMAAKALEERRRSLARTAPGGTSHMTSVLRGANYSLTDEMSTGSIGKIPGTGIDVDPGSLVGFVVDIVAGEAVERGISAVVKQAAPAVARSAVRTATINTLSSRAARRSRPGVAPKPGGALARKPSMVNAELEGDVIIAGPAKIVTPAPPKQRVLSGTPPTPKAATIPDYRAVVVRPASRGTGKAVVNVPTNPDRPVVVQTIQAVPEPAYTQVHRSAPTPAYNQPKPTGPGGQFELPLGTPSVPVIPSLLDNTPIAARVVEGMQLPLPGVLPERKQFGMLGAEFHPDNSVVFKGLDDMFEDGDVIEARKFFTELAETGANPVVKLSATLDADMWDNQFVNAVHMGFKPIANDGTILNPNLVEFGTDVTLQLTRPSVVNKTDTRTGAEVLGLDEFAPKLRTVADVTQATDSLIGVVPSPTTRRLYERISDVIEPDDTPARRAYADVLEPSDENMSLRTLVGSLEPSVRTEPGNPVTRYRMMRDSGERVAEHSSVRTRKFGSVTAEIDHFYQDLYTVGFTVDGRTIKEAGSPVPVKDISDFSKFVMDLHKRNPTVSLMAEISAVTDSEWVTKFRAYTRAGFTPVDELGEELTSTPQTGDAVVLLFNPSNVQSGVLARRLASAESLVAVPDANPAFVELAQATQMKETLEAMRVQAENVVEMMYGRVYNLASPSRRLSDELPRRNIEGIVDVVPVTKKHSTFDTVYHGSRVVADDIAQLDHLNGGSPSSLGVGMHITTDALHAQAHASKMVNADLPSAVAREYGPPAVSRYGLDGSANVLDANTPYAEVADVAKNVLREIAPEIVELIPTPVSVIDVIQFVDSELDNPTLATLFQREFSNGLRDGGVDVIEASNKGRVVLNADVLIPDGLNVPVRGVIDDALSATRYTEIATQTDHKVLQTPRSETDYVESAFMTAQQNLDEIRNVQHEIAERVSRAVDDTTLWDFDGIPDVDKLPRYADNETPIRYASSPFDTQTLDVSPCTL